MSWSFTIQKPTKAEAKQAVADNPSVKEYKSVPPAVVVAINAAIDALPDSTTREVNISTHGHMDQDADGVARDTGAPIAAITVTLATPYGKYP